MEERKTKLFLQEHLSESLFFRDNVFLTASPGDTHNELTRQMGVTVSVASKCNTDMQKSGRHFRFIFLHETAYH